MIDFLLQIVRHTPVWVWGVLALIVAVGARQMRPRDVSPQRVLLVPAILGGFSLWSASSAFALAGPALVLPAWIAGIAIGWSSNRALDLPRRVAANADGSFRVDGSVAPLLLMLAVFVARYVNAVALAVQPALATRGAYVLGATFLLALPAGLFIARARKTWAARRGLVAAAA